MANFKDLLEQELAELTVKTDTLAVFINGSNFDKLPQHHQALLHTQLGIMTSYIIVLTQRLNLLNAEAKTRTES